MFDINLSGYMIKEKKGHSVCRTAGSGDYIFLYFPVPMVFEESEEMISLRKNACIVYSPDAYQNFHGVDTFENTYIHFSDSENLMKSFSFPLNTVFYPVSYLKMNECAKIINEEILRGDAMCHEMASIKLNEILILCERHFKKPEVGSIKKLFNDIRIILLEDISKNYSIDELAQLACMSKSRFYDYYKSFFGSTPKKDLLKTRMEKAKILLTNENYRVSEISEMVGFNNIEHFIRYYKMYYGITPGEERRGRK